MPRVYERTTKFPAKRVQLDPIDVDLLRYSWRDLQGYAVRGPVLVHGKKVPISLHQVVLERMLGRRLNHGEVTDHINGDRQDNRRCNLRIATKSQNGFNRGADRRSFSRYVGVTRARIHGRWAWQAYLNIDGVRVLHTKRSSELECAWMYDQYALALHGEFARLNFGYLPVPAQLSTPAVVNNATRQSIAI